MSATKEPEQEGEYIYGCSKEKYIKFVMSGGSSEWYHYKILFNEQNEQTAIFRVDKNGTRQIHKDDKAILIRNDEGSEYIKFVFDYANYELEENEYELEYNE